LVDATADTSEHLGTFTGGTISDSVTIKAALQALETAVETKGVTAGSSSILTVGVLDAGSITSNFGNIDNGASSIACGSLDVSDGNITSVGDIALDSISADGSAITINPPTTFAKAIIQANDAITQSSSTITVDWSAGNFYTCTLSANVDTVQFQNVTVGQRIVLRLLQPGSAKTWTNGDADAFRGSTGTGTSNATVKWAGGGTAPTITASGSVADTFGFICIAEDTYDGYVIGQDIQ
jgi:hypothetical protein